GSRSRSPSERERERRAGDHDPPRAAEAVRSAPARRKRASLLRSELSPEQAMKRALILAAAVALVAPRANADTSDACASASESGQALQRQGKLLDARQKFVTCSRVACPDVVRRDCDNWLTVLDGILPSIVVVTRDEGGHDVVAVRVSLDGRFVDVSN